MAEANKRPDPFHHDRSTWGDEPEEVDASAVVEELPTAWPETERRWHDHPAFVPFKAVAMFIKRSGKRIAITAVGGFLLIAGIALLVLPGPGWLLIFLGLGVLATEYVWAERLLKTAKQKAEQAKNKVLGKKTQDDTPES